MALALLVVLVVACTGGEQEQGAGSAPDRSPPSVPSPPAPGFSAAMACGLGPDLLARVRAGVEPARSGEVQIVPAEPNTIGNWFSHSGPWDYLQRVPLLFYGPGVVPARGEVGGRATLTDVAPTVARLAGFDYQAPDGRVLEQVLADGETEPPALVVTMVWDSAGRNVLDEHPDDWPTLKSLASQGVWFDDAEVGVSPTISATVHATIGTGAEPRRHGWVDHWFRTEPGGPVVFVEEVGTQTLLLPTMAERYDRSTGNQAEVGLVAYDNWYVGLIGQGTYRDGGDADTLVQRVEDGWGIKAVSEPHFDHPAYVDDIARPDPGTMDGEDGTVDGSWFGEDLLGEDDFARKVANSRWQVAIVEEVVRREGFGDDDVPDLLFLNFKHVDEAGHTWTMNSPQMGGIVRATDLALADLVAFLDQEVGRGRWAMAVMADHGATPKVEESGAFQVDEGVFRRHLREAFDADDDDRPAILKQRPTQIWVDPDELAENGFTVGQVARWLAEYTIGDHLGDAAPAGRADERIFAAAFETEVLDGLRCG
jgi:predicted AlkP superfamily pyrophosphatase or phosphodiesterase